MDTSASPKPGADNKEVYGFFLKIDGGRYSAPSYQKNTVIKYTKLPDFDFDTKVSWPNLQSYELQPRLRRIVSLEDDDFKTNRSLRSITVPPPKAMATTTSRKVVTISEDDEHGLYPTYTKVKKPNSVKMTNRSIETDYKLEKPASNRTTSRLANSAKYTKEIKTSAKVSAYNKKEVNVNQQQNYRGKPQTVLSSENTRTKYSREKDVSRSSRSANQSKSSVSKNFCESVKELTRIKNILYDNLKTHANSKKPIEKPKLNQSPSSSFNKNKVNLKDISSSKSKQLTIRVPLDEKYVKPKITTKKSNSTLKFETTKLSSTDRSQNTDPIIQYSHVNIGTEPVKSIDRMTEIDDVEIISLCQRESTVQTESIKETFDSLEIPNVTLTKDKPEIRKAINNVLSTPIIQVPPIETFHKEEISSSDISFCQNAYIFSRATVTYTSRQKINFQIVDSDERISPNIPPSPLEYPINVISVFKNELKNENEKPSKNDTSREEKNANKEYLNCMNELNSLNCSYINNKLIKPSDIISTIRVNNGLLQNDYICEQFQRELNFIDSFFESLQYLEGCSLSDKCLSDNKVEGLVNNSVLFDSTFDVKNSEYDNFLSKLGNGANVDDAETMASKSLCLLNLLIRDEQRRAKNLLFVLKMREDALKDFTKSQILWLEKKKKQDNTDISTLKKKQRGALLKLQHECGEMQRMRKALLALSEKRKLALIKTKKNIELKLKNNVDVDNIILGKKKLKRSFFGDRNASPLKCFDLSSSGCEDSTISRHTSDSAVLVQQTGNLVNVRSVEKCVQTGDVCSYNKHHDVEIAPENFIAVDGGYLNILFRDLMLPQIFSNGKQYEVNEDALKNIVISTNNQINNLNGSEVVEKLMEQIKNRDLDTSSPSTARSLVEEFDQYYRDLTAEDNYTAESPEGDNDYSTRKVFELRDACVQSDFNESIETPIRTSVTPYSAESVFNNDVMLSECDKSCVCEPVNLDSVCLVDKGTVLTGIQSQTGPLPVPVGAVADNNTPDVPTWAPPKSSSSASDTDSEVSLYTDNQSVSSLISLSTPVQCEAEELRRQQLAIEREIKALEQQQCRLLVVREIPDKPPPPYIPPAEIKPKLPRPFILDENSTRKIESFITDPANALQDEIQDVFDEFLKDFCEESLIRQKQNSSERPWDASNLLPKKPSSDIQKIAQNIIKESKEVLTSVPPTHVSGVSSRRSDHIDDILFTEWRRCEPEWTALHNDEAIVKNQLFDSIFQKILSETIDEYKKTVTTDEITVD